MNNDLRENFNKFKTCSLNILESINKEDYDELEKKIEERQMILDSIMKLDFSQEEIKKVVEELEINKISEEINFILNEKKVDLKDKMDKVALTKRVNSNYNKSFYNNSNFFNKKI